MARLQYAEACLAEVAKLSERDILLGGLYQREHARVAHFHATAAKDNATVYLETVPPLAQLPLPLALPLAVTLPLPLTRALTLPLTPTRCRPSPSYLQ